MEPRKMLFSPPDISEEEIEEVVDTLRSGWITTGPKTKLFERKLAEYCGVKRVACMNSSTACAEMALRILGIGPGDEVITSAYTYTASASVICHVGAKVVLVDVQKDSYELDYDQLEEAINENTKAVIPVDIAGIPCDYDRIFEIVKTKSPIFKPKGEIQKALGRIAVVADAAHALGAVWKGKKVGSIADFTSFSFHAVKNLTTAEGGALAWRSIPGINDEDIYNQCMLLSLHGQSKDALAKTKLGAWEYDIVAPFYKCNMTDIMASIGIVQLKRYPELLKRRREIIEKYNSGLSGLNISVAEHFNNTHCSSGHLYLSRLTGKNREETNEIIIRMAEKGVATNVHYKPLPMLTAYKNLGFCIDNYPNAYKMFENEISLPLHTLLSDDDVDYIIQTLKDILN